MKLTRSRLLEIIVVLLVLSYPFVSEIIYHRDISPSSRSDFTEFLGMLDESSSVRVLDTADGRIMKFTGFGPRRGLLAIPSSAPQYFFDESGVFLEWVRDPGDMETPERFQATVEGELISFEEAVERIKTHEITGHNKPPITSPNPPRVD